MQISDGRRYQTGGHIPVAHTRAEVFDGQVTASYSLVLRHMDMKGHSIVSLKCIRQMYQTGPKVSDARGHQTGEGIRRPQASELEVSKGREYHTCVCGAVRRTKVSDARRSQTRGSMSPAETSNLKPLTWLGGLGGLVIGGYQGYVMHAMSS